MLCFFVCIFAPFYVDLKIVKACLYASHVILNAYFVHGVQLFVFNIFMFVCIICVIISQIQVIGLHLFLTAVR